MDPSLRSYKVRILSPEEHIDELGGEEQVCVNFYDELGRDMDQRTYKKVLVKDVYDSIEKGEPIDLDNCYVFGLDLNTYRKEKGSEQDEWLLLPPFSARGCFFDHHYSTDLSGAHFTGEKVDLSGSAFAHGIVRFRKTRSPEGGMDLKGAWFGEGDLDLKFAEFQKGGVDLEDASFGKGRISFVNVEFGEGPINFRNAELGDGDLDFHFARFSSGNICFDGIVLGEGKLDMRKADFGDGRFDMRRAYVGEGDVLFDESEFRKGKVNFRSTIFGKGRLSFHMSDLGEGDVVFDKADFGEGSISFRRAKMERVSFRDCHIDHYMDLRVEKADRIDLSDTVVSGLIDLIPSGTVDIGVLYITRMRNLGQLYVDWKKNNVEGLIERQSETDHKEKADQYRILKQDFSSIGDYEAEDLAYVRFKRQERKAELKERTEQGIGPALYAYPLTAFQWLVFDKMGKYATSPLRVFISILVTYTAFSLAYAFLPPLIEGDIVKTQEGVETLNLLERGFYHSGVPFLTIGSGNYHPVGHFRWISTIEGFIGVFLMSYFTVAFVRKILR